MNQTIITESQFFHNCVCFMLYNTKRTKIKNKYKFYNIFLILRHEKSPQHINEYGIGGVLNKRIDYSTLIFMLFPQWGQEERLFFGRTSSGDTKSCHVSTTQNRCNFF